MTSTRVIEALNAYLSAREDAGYEFIDITLSESDGLYFLQREDLYPLTLGSEAEAVVSLRKSASLIRNA